MNQQMQERFADYLRIKSVANTADIAAANKWLHEWLTTFCDSVETVGAINPLIRAYIKGRSDKTLCLYGHYDVQPATESDGWDADPFQPVITDDVVIARGVCDNKGQNFAFLSVLENMVRNHKKPQHNILVLLEGEEEIGSPHLKEYLLRDRAANQADYYLLVDGTSPYTDRPALYTGSLGVVFGELAVDSQHGDLHSGIFGEEATQPVAALAAVIQDLYSDKLALDFSAVEDWSFSVNYLSAGSDSAKSIIPGRASAMISYRFSAGIEPTTITASLRDYCAELSIKHKMDIGFSPRVIIKATELQPGWLFNQCSESLTEIGLTHFIGRLQGSLPVASVINEIYGADSVILSSGSKGNHTHGVNERMAISSIRRSMSFFEHMLE